MNFDYAQIPPGFYDDILHGENSMRKFWHYHKFESVLRFIPDELKGKDKKILDVGCFGGSFLGMVPEEMFGEQLGVDMLPGQVEYAQKKYSKPWRQFELNNNLLAKDSSLENKFHIITLIEVIEHLNEREILELLSELIRFLRPGGQIIITTPNYLSTWPILELILNFLSDVKYEEQHITKFNFFNINEKVRNLSQRKLQLLSKTTTHFLTPFLAPISYSLSEKLAAKVPSSQWHNPFGNIILTRWGIN